MEIKFVYICYVSVFHMSFAMGEYFVSDILYKLFALDILVGFYK